jgi:hypothetical protein
MPPIGGLGSEVEIGLTLVGKRKTNVGQRRNGVWIFGGIERFTLTLSEENVPKWFAVPIKNRKKETILPLVLKHISPGMLSTFSFIPIS